MRLAGQSNGLRSGMGDPGYFDQDLNRYRSATPSALREAASRYLKPDARVILSVVPRGRVALALAGSRPVAVS